MSSSGTNPPGTDAVKALEILNYVFVRDRLWFLESPASDAPKPDGGVLLSTLAGAFEAGEACFSAFSDPQVQAGLMFLASHEGVGGSVFSDLVPFEVRSRFLLAHIPMFRDVVAVRAANPASELNEVCLSYFDSFIEYCGVAPLEVVKHPVFLSLHTAMHSLFGICLPLDQGIHRAFTRWFPHLLEQ